MLVAKISSRMFQRSRRQPGDDRSGLQDSEHTRLRIDGSGSQGSSLSALPVIASETQNIASSNAHGCEASSRRDVASRRLEGLAD